MNRLIYMYYNAGADPEKVEGGVKDVRVQSVPKILLINIHLFIKID